MESKGVVCVTGCAGFIASHLVKLLLENGYRVRGTVRSLQKPENYTHLLSLPAAKERLELHEADLMKEGSFNKAIEGCEGVFHTASPFFFKNIKDPELEMIRPAVEGTLNVLRSCKANKSVKHVIVTSSMAAVMMGGFPETHLLTEDDWSSEQILRDTEQWYLLSKTLAEKACWKFYEEERCAEQFRFAVINPSMVLGPLLQPIMNTSNELILKLVDGSRKKHGVMNMIMNFVDVRDVAEAHLRVYENTSQSTPGRYLCNSCSSSWINVCDTLRECFPNSFFTNNIPTVVSGFNLGDRPNPVGYSKIDNRKLSHLGVKFRLLEEMLFDTVMSLDNNHFLDNVKSSSSSQSSLSSKL